MTDSVSHRLKALQNEFREKAFEMGRSSTYRNGDGRVMATLHQCADALTPLIASGEGRTQEPQHWTCRDCGTTTAVWRGHPVCAQCGSSYITSNLLYVRSEPRDAVEGRTQENEENYLETRVDELS